MTSLDLHTHGPKYLVHPVVVFSILDHYKRRNKGQKTVIGTLLGYKNAADGTVVIKNCFPLKEHRAKSGDPSVDIGYHRQMLSLHQRVNKSEVVVGWYSNAGDLTFAHSKINDTFRNEVSEGSLPVLLTVDTALTSNMLGIKGYVANTIYVHGKAVMSRFENAQVEITAFDAEKIGVDALLNGTPDSEKMDAPATLMTDLEGLYYSMDNLLRKLEVLNDYVEKVQRKEIKGEPQLGRAVASALSRVNQVTQENFEKMINVHVQDLMMIVYLANLTRQQLALADNVSGLL